ncbi:50S ribosomal protein L2 [Thermodesulfovibrionales bacterium]|nr:50S ribosomal protein L2 [Thermodesulfovibrionales bacterium]MCL0037408.1 50S ribosomal protein L2 [Thermodesulfovibrionales bacterium]MCL0049813.1 50S ribosomal protein L2 [Thermodesulfovibrionales bacterium]MCL0062052.1 50S ribosomal protein L2 [Thermodesulfovibrionales bacterium]MCL0069077.1 50S ribosomal protein L2 [Thermodesulfovibrionales bacterium]
MGIKKFKPTSTGRRFQSAVDYKKDITTDKPHKPLTGPLKKTGGRNNTGRITVWQRGGGSKRMHRVIDFKRDRTGVPATVKTIEYDPNRSARIALLKYRDGEQRYILAPIKLNVGDTVVAGPDSEIKEGNALPIAKIPLGTMIHNIELRPGQGARLVRTAGAAAQIVAKEEKYAQIKMPSGEVRLILTLCMATIGQVGNPDHENISYGKAGRIRYLGRRPHVRGVAMNPIDHPLGGGEGKASGGRPACSPWGKPEGVRTRHNKRTDKFIIKKRKK